MQHFLLKRADGCVSIMVADDDTTCEPKIAKWSPEMQAEISWPRIARARSLAAGPLLPQRLDARCDESSCRQGHGRYGEGARDTPRGAASASRKPLLDAADVDYIKADEAADEPRKAEVRAYKQALRDVPQDPRIDAAQTPEELKAIVPDALL